MLSFTIAHLSVIRCASRSPTAPRPYRGPGTLRVAGRELPLFAVLADLRHGPGVRRRHDPAPRRRRRRRVLAGARHGALHRLSQTARSRPAHDHAAPRHERPADFEELDYKTALVPIFGDDVSAERADQRRQADRRGRRRLRDLRAAGARASSRSRRASRRRRRTGARCSRARASRRGATASRSTRADPHAQPGRGARRGGRARRLRRDLLVDDPRAARRAADRADGGVPAAASAPAA